MRRSATASGPRRGTASAAGRGRAAETARPGAGGRCTSSPSSPPAEKSGFIYLFFCRWGFAKGGEREFMDEEPIRSRRVDAARPLSDAPPRLALRGLGGSRLADLCSPRGSKK